MIPYIESWETCHSLKETSVDENPVIFGNKAHYLMKPLVFVEKRQKRNAENMMDCTHTPFQFSKIELLKNRTTTIALILIPAS